MTILRAAIVDDEPLARTRLRRLLSRIGSGGVEVVAECVDVDELLETAAGVDLDVVFLDIEMPGGNGFSALTRWRGPRPQIVFVTAYPQHGALAFDVRAVDYLLKPVAEDRLRDTLERLQAAERSGASADEPVPAADRLPLKAGQRTHLVAMDRIDLVVAEGNYLQVHADGSVYAVRSTLTDFQRRLDGRRFVKIHRSSIVRIAAVREVRAAGSARFRVILRDGRSLHSGRRFREAVMALMRDGAGLA